jgi:hypothetical protein
MLPPSPLAGPVPTRGLPRLLPHPPARTLAPAGPHAHPTAPGPARPRMPARMMGRIP